MRQVGDEATHAAFLAALGRSHGIVVRVRAWLGGQPLGDVEFDSGTVQVSGRARERRSLELVVPERLWAYTEAGGLVSPYGTWLTVTRAVVAGAREFPEVPIFAGRLEDVTRARWSGRVRITAADPMRQVNAEPFERPRGVRPGTRIIDAIAVFIREVFPDAGVRPVGLDAVAMDAAVPVGAALMWDAEDGSRGKAIEELAAAIGAEVYAEPTTVAPGGSFVIRPVPSLADAVAWELPAGEASIVVEDEEGKARAGVVSRVIVMVERPNTAPMYVPVTDTDPASPTRYGGPMGRPVKFHRDSLIVSAAQAGLAGRALLARYLGLARTRTVTTVVNPALESGDVLRVPVEGETGVHIVDEFAVPLSPDPPTMTIGTRSTQDTGSEGA